MLDLTNPQHAHIDQRLREDAIMWLGTVRPDGRPHMVVVWFLWDGESVLIFSQPNQKVRNLRANPHVVLSLDNTRGGGDVITMIGVAELPLPGSITAAKAEYVEKYGEMMRDINLSVDEMATIYSQPIRIHVERFV